MWSTFKQFLEDSPSESHVADEAAKNKLLMELVSHEAMDSVSSHLSN